MLAIRVRFDSGEKGIAEERVKDVNPGNGSLWGARLHKLASDVGSGNLGHHSIRFPFVPWLSPNVLESRTVPDFMQLRPGLLRSITERIHLRSTYRVHTKQSTATRGRRSSDRVCRANHSLEPASSRVKARSLSRGGES